MNPHQEYYDAISKMEEAGVNKDYIIGWQSAYWLNPEIEEQRTNDAYQAGYEKGKEKDASGFEAWAGK